jgi:hypothetical protein
MLKDEFEFVGPWMGPIGIVAGLPCVCYLLVFFCSDGECLELLPFKVPEGCVSMKKTLDIYSHAGLEVFLGWIAYVVILHLILPGRSMDGVKLANGTRLTYKMNGDFTAATAAATYRLRQLPFPRLYIPFPPPLDETLRCAAVASL